MNALTRPILLLMTVAVTACASTSVRDRAADYLALRHAAESGDELLVRALLERGTPVDPLDIDAAGDLTLGVAEANSPLQIAAEKGQVEIVRMLLLHHPWIDRRCCDGPSALGYASANGSVEIVRLLLQAGADPNLRSEFGTALDMARRAGHEDIVRSLAAVMSPDPSLERTHER